MRETSPATAEITRLSPVLLTGATGFIGRRLAARWAAAGAEVAALVLPGEADRLPEGVRPLAGDVAERAVVRSAVDQVRPACVVHMAAVGVTNPQLFAAEALRVNVGGTLALLDAIREVGGVRRVVGLGSAYEYGARRSADGFDPFNAYGASKVAAWAFARAAYNSWQAPVVWVRPFQVYGPGQPAQTLIPAAIGAALAGDDFPMTKGEQRRDFVFVDDVVAGIEAAALAPGIAGRALDLGTGRQHAVREVVERIWALTGATGEIHAGARPYRPGEVAALPARAARTRRLTGWQAATALDAGLRQTIEDFGF